MTSSKPMLSTGSRARRLARAIIGPLALTAAVATFTASANASPLFVGGYDGRIGEYDAATGAAINATLVSTSPTFFIEDFALRANTFYATDAGSVRTYNATTGALINASFITGLATLGIEVAGNTVYVTDSTPNRVSTYDATTGALINSNFIPLSSTVYSIEVFGNDLYLGHNGSVSKYNATTGALINASFITAPAMALVEGIAVSGNTVYVGLLTSPSSVRTYNATTGALINASFITGLSALWDVEIEGNNLYVADLGLNAVREYNATTGALINASFITGKRVTALAIQDVPEPATLALVGVGLAGLGFSRRKR